MVRYLAAIAFLTISCAGRAADNPLLLLQDPTLSESYIVFEYGGELWEVPRSGGEAHVLASGLDLLDGPIFSPDGERVAFTGTYDSNPQLMDGGTVTAPHTAVEALDGTFPVENHGIAPDVMIWQDPALVRQGHDPQLEPTVSIALEQLREHPPARYERAPWRNYHPHLPPLPGSN
jgi:hypothetical protein